MSTPRVLGLDLSITATGVAMPDGQLDTLRPSTVGDYRLDEIAQAVGILAAGVDVVAIEEGLVKSFASFKLGMVHGAVRRRLIVAGIPYALVAPATLKKYATGSGGSGVSKADMRMALYKRAEIDERDDNRVDAWWLRAAALDAYGYPIVEMPRLNVEALGKVEWPATHHARLEAS